MPKTDTTAPTSISRPKGRRWAWAFLGLILATHGVQAVRLFPTLRSIVDPGSPVLVVDHAIHEYHGSLGARFFREVGTTWGIDPYFMAGYPETPVWDSSSNPSILFDLVGGSGGFRSYKVGLLVSMILLMPAVAAGAWMAGLRPWEVSVATALAWFAFWTGFPISLWRSGLFAFVTASGGAGLLLGLCVRFDRQPSRLGWVVLSMVGAGLFFVHVTTPVLVVGGLLAFLITVGRRQSRGWLMAVIGSAMLAVLANLFWLVPLWRFREIRAGGYGFMTSRTAWFLARFFLTDIQEGRTGLVLVVLGVSGLLAWWFTGRRPAASAFGGSSLLLLVLLGFGSLWEPTRVLEPLRFRTAMFLLLAVPAGSSVVGLTSRLARWVGGGGVGAIAAGLAWVAVLGGWYAADRPFFQQIAVILKEHRPLVVGFRPEMKRMAEWLRENTDNSARILFEDQLRLLESTDAESVHWTPLLPSMLGADARMFIGGLYQTAFIRHHQMAAFGDFQLGDRPIDEWSSLDLSRYCEQYNVGWVVCWSPLSRFWFDHHPPARRVATLPRYGTPYRPVSTNRREWTAIIDGAGLEVAKRYMLEGESQYAIYRLERPHSFFLKGKGRVVGFGPNWVELADLEPRDGALVLSLHWFDTWKTDPPLTLKPVAVPGDPVDFVQIELPRAINRVRLWNHYGRR